MRQVGFSTIGKKFIVGLTGIALFLFVVTHLLENLLLLLPDPNIYNRYAHTLMSLGPLIYAVEILLLTVFIFHIGGAIAVTRQNRAARSTPYALVNRAGAPSRKTLSSTTMAITGLVILLFVILHLINFKYGPSIEQGYVVHMHDEEVRDLYRLVAETFQQPLYVAGYVAAMIFLGFHLRHGFWSAFQSLGAMHPRYSSFIYTLGVLFAILLAAGFIFLPLYLYFRGVLLS